MTRTLTRRAALAQIGAAVACASAGILRPADVDRLTPASAPPLGRPEAPPMHDDVQRLLDDISSLSDGDKLWLAREIQKGGMSEQSQLIARRWELNLLARMVGGAA